ncbi:MAG: hypothetical protein EXQ85_08085 [Alphaproteobacteria bacterium]|nr:hypothetical protein [Alphaproteobacteria bacterium]
MEVTLFNLAARLLKYGLLLRGGFDRTHSDEDLPKAPASRAAQTVVLVGNAGSAMWRAFKQSGFGEGADPLNRWIESELAPLAAEMGAAVYYAHSGPPFLPFLSWAQRCEPVHPSPLGLFLHPDYGPWHAYRAAFVFAERLALAPRRDAPAPCDSCADKPCLSACPIPTLRGQVLHIDACVRHPTGAGCACEEGGCLARRACPIGTAYRYEPEHARFHMAAFLRARPER